MFRCSLLFVFLMVCAHSSAAFAASTASGASATIVSPIGIGNTTALAFGTVVAGTGGTVVISTAGSRTKTGGVTLTSLSLVTAAAFAVGGESTATYAITLPASAATLTRVGHSETMTVGAFVSDPSGTGVLSGGEQRLLVGATLNVGPGQTSGTYTGEFAVSVNYN